MKETPDQYFLRNLGTSPKVLELGCLRWGQNHTHHRDIFPEGAEHIKSDVKAGIDVDIVADAHKLTDVFAENSFDVVYAASVWEHLHSPWIAAEQVLKILKPGGVALICTHNCFPIHGYPSDYFRFTDKALEHIFNKASHMVSGYEIPCVIQKPDEVEVWCPHAPAYILVKIAIKK